VLDKANIDVVDEVNSFVKKSSKHEDGKLPAGFVITGPSGIASGHFINRMHTSVTSQDEQVLITLAASECPNLKTCLKVLIRKGVGEDNIPDQDDNATVNTFNGRRLLNFDLQLLDHHCKKQRLKEVIVAFRDSEAYAASLLSEIVIVLQYGNSYVSWFRND